MRWAAASERDLGARAGAIAVAGDSAGGNLAAVAALQLRGSGIAIAHQLLLYPVVDCATKHPSYASLGDGYFLTADAMRWFKLDLLDAEPSAHSWPLHAALQRIDAAGCGVAVRLDCDMRGDAMRTPAGHARRDGRVTGIGSQILRELGLRRLKVLSRPFRLPALSGHDLEIMAFIPLGDDDPESARGAHASPLRAA